MVDTTVILHDDHGVRLRYGENVESRMEWSDIYCVSCYAFELDGAHWLGVVVDDDGGNFIELLSVWPGFADATAALSRHLPGIDSQWLVRAQELTEDDEPLVVWQR